jgi:hypothetical protein
VHAAFEVAVARQHRGADEISRLGDALALTGLGSGPELPMQVVQP